MLTEIALQALAPSPTNPRKTFDPVKLQELAASIAQKGVLSPLVVRPAGPHPPWTKEGKNGVTHEVVAGERRYRAAGIAGLATVPCIVRELTDVEVLEIQTIENLQRDDLHPLEEAQGYAALMKEAGYDVAAIAAKVGKSEKYVYDRMKLLQLVPELREVFLAGEITAGHAILLARLSKKEQLRVHEGEGNVWRVQGLWTADHGRVDPDDPKLDLDDPVKRKAVSVRELATYIEDHVRFRPGEVDLPNLFPETAAALQAAAEEELKVVKITREYRCADDAKDEKERTYGSQSWKRADGEEERDSWTGKTKKSKTCEHSILGVVVAGPGRGEAFRVCVAKKKCKVHWAEEQKAANQRGAPNGAGTKSGRQDWEAEDRARRQKWEEKRRRAEVKRARWKKAAPKLLEALAEKLKATPALELADFVLDRCKGHRPLKSKLLERGNTVEDAFRFAAWIILAEHVLDEWRAPEVAPASLKRVGLNAKKIVDQVAPRPKAEKPKKAKAADVKKAGARARRRTKKAAGMEVQTSAGSAN